MNLDEIFQRELLIISGKGGVGKTTVATTLGLLAAERGKKTLIAEINAAEKISEIFEVKPIGYKETKLANNLFAINIDPHSAFHEYVLEQIHSTTLYHLVFENNLVKNFLDATPGLNTLLEIGKIWALAERDKDESGKNPKYDLVIVDAPATGHGLALLQVPQIVSSAVRVGPIRNKAEGIVDLLKNPKKTLLLITTLAEEMPINEAIEMLHQAENKLSVPTGPLFVNALFPSILSDSEWSDLEKKLMKKKEKKSQTFQKILHYYQQKVELQKFYLNKLKTEIEDHEIFKLPYLFYSDFNREVIEELGKVIETY